MGELAYLNINELFRKAPNFLRILEFLPALPVSFHPLEDGLCVVEDLCSRVKGEVLERDYPGTVPPTRRGPSDPEEVIGEDATKDEIRVGTRFGL